jgi:hypothetical protein
MAAIASLRYFLLISHLHKIAVLDHGLDLLLSHLQHVACCLLELLLFIVVDVRLVALREAVNKNSTLSPAEEDDCTVATRLAPAWPWDPLLNDAAAKIDTSALFRRALLRLPGPGRGSFPFEQSAQTIAS